MIVIKMQDEKVVAVKEGSDELPGGSLLRSAELGDDVELRMLLEGVLACGGTVQVEAYAGKILSDVVGHSDRDEPSGRITLTEAQDLRMRHALASGPMARRDGDEVLEEKGLLRPYDGDPADLEPSDLATACYFLKNGCLNHHLFSVES